MSSRSIRTGRLGHIERQRVRLLDPSVTAMDAEFTFQRRGKIDLEY